MATLTIPGNIKQQFLPFVLDKTASINSPFSNSIELAGSVPQYFTFRDGNIKKKKGLLNICPSSYKQYMKGDLSNQLLFSSSYNAIRGSVTFNDIFNQLPGLQIREFLPDTKLDQCINFFGDMLNMIKDAWSQNEEKAKSATSGSAVQLTEAEKNKIKDEYSKSFMSHMSEVLQHAFGYFTGTETPNIYTDNTASMGSAPASSYSKTDEVSQRIIDWPYDLYYTLQSCVTTNIYELPCKTEDNVMYQSDGVPGWKGDNFIGINSLLSKIPGIGTVLNSILGNIRINYMPWWDSSEGSKTPPPVITIKVNLFNDTAEAAMQNFIFVNTLIPNNMWIQYGMFQHSPCLYDIKLEGYNRLFACAGAFCVNALGTLRTPSVNWVKTLVDEHANGNGKIIPESLKKNIIDGKLIKIPDVYQVTMTFTSLLPANFNNYIYQYAQNTDIPKQYNDSKYTYQSGAASKLLGEDGAVAKFTTNVTKYIKQLLS